jgi:hypothetical protein
VIIVAVQQLEGNVLQPMLQARSLRLHAAVVLLAVTAGSTLYGIAGAFLSVPATAAAAVVVRYLGERIDARVGVPREILGAGEDAAPAIVAATDPDVPEPDVPDTRESHHDGNGGRA